MYGTFTHSSIGGQIYSIPYLSSYEQCVKSIGECCYHLLWTQTKAWHYGFTKQVYLYDV